MLDWLKTILGEAYSEEIDKKVSEEIGKNFVARADFNTLNTEKKALADTVKERDKQLRPSRPLPVTSRRSRRKSLLSRPRTPQRRRPMRQKSSVSKSIPPLSWLCLLPKRRT